MKNIVTVGGGTGTFVTPTGLRRLSEVSLTAIVTSADDGGSTGRLRDAYGFLPAGDARQALVALSEDASALRDLFGYRFGKGDLAGHTLGNLFITALTDLLGSDAAALEEASRILRVRGTVLQSCLTPATLVAVLKDGTILTSEHALDERIAGRSPVATLALATPCEANPRAITALTDADLIVLGPGDLYTSTIAALLPHGMRDAIADSPARLVYVTNLFTKPGQTEGYGARRHVDEVARYAGRQPDGILINRGDAGEDALARYAGEGELPVEDDFLPEDARVHRAPLASTYTVPPVPGDPLPRSLVRHDPAKLSAALSTFL